MFDQRPSNAERGGARRDWEWGWGILLLLCIPVISSCGASSPAPTTPVQPSSPASAHPFHATVKTFDGAFTVTLAITPNRSGPNLFTVQVKNAHSGKPATQVVITLYTTMQDMAMGTDSILLHPDGDGLFSVTGNNLDMEGHWAIGMTIQTPDHVIHKAGVSLTIFPPNRSRVRPLANGATSTH